MATCASCRASIEDAARFCPRCGHPQARAEPGDPLIGALLDGRYRVESFIGRGGMATVYLARHEGLGRHVAVKLLHETISHDYPSVERFRREARAISRIAHPNVVSVLDFALDRELGRFFLAMEHVPGISLRTAIERGGGFELSRALHVLSQVGAALRECHGRGIVHRDLKAENVMLTRRGHDASFAKLLDFGLTRPLAADPEVARLTRTDQLLGSPVCMAPEQWRGEPLDERTDVYALGILAYEMLTGGSPFEGDTPFAYFLCHVERPVEPPSRRATGLPRAVDELVLRALAKDKDDRFASMDEVLATIGTIWRREELRGPVGRVSYAGTAAAPPATVDLAYAATLAHGAALDPVDDGPDLCAAAGRVASLRSQSLAGLVGRAWPGGAPQAIREKVTALASLEAGVAQEAAELAALRERAEAKDTLAAARRSTLHGELLDASDETQTLEDTASDRRRATERALAELARERERAQALMEREVVAHLREAQRRLDAIDAECAALAEAITQDGLSLEWDDAEQATLRRAMTDLSSAIGSIAPEA